jgi:hypothetical protein
MGALRWWCNWLRGLETRRKWVLWHAASAMGRYCPHFISEEVISSALIEAAAQAGLKPSDSRYLIRIGLQHGTSQPPFHTVGRAFAIACGWEQAGTLTKRMQIRERG